MLTMLEIGEPGQEWIKTRLLNQSDPKRYPNLPITMALYRTLNLMDGRAFSMVQPQPTRDILAFDTGAEYSNTNAILSLAELIMNFLTFNDNSVCLIGEPLCLPQETGWQKKFSRISRHLSFIAGSQFFIALTKVLLLENTLLISFKILSIISFAVVSLENVPG